MVINNHSYAVLILKLAVEGAIWPKTLTGFQGLAGSALQDEGAPSEH